MPKHLGKLHTKYLKVAAKSVDGNSFLFHNVEVRNNIGFDDQTSAGYALLLRVEEELLQHGFLTVGSVPEHFILTTKAVKYIHWQKTNAITTFGRLVFNFFQSSHTKKILSGFFLVFLFLVVERIGYEFLYNSELSNAVQLLNSNSNLRVAFDIAFLLILLLFVIRNYRVNFTHWDLLIVFAYLYFRSGLSLWVFWQISVFKNSSILYIDAIAIYYLSSFSITIIKKLLYRREIVGITYLDRDLSLKEKSELQKVEIAEIDSLGRYKFASQIAHEVLQMHPYRAFAIGINGPWGCGKTSLIDLIIYNLKTNDYGERLNFIEFYPWLSKDSEGLLTNFFEILEQSFKSNKQLSDDILQYSKAIKTIEKKFFDTNFLDFLDAKHPTTRARYDAISNKLKNHNKCLVVKIDDLDRLGKEEIVNTLRLIRIIADFPNTVYIVGYDKRYIDSAIRETLTNFDPEKYIYKVFNVEFRIPEVSTSTLMERLFAHLSLKCDALLQEHRISAAQFDEIKLCFNSIDFDISYFIENERDIIRFTNNMLMRYLSIKEEVNFSDFFKLELVNYRSPEIYYAVYSNKDKLTN